MNAITFLALGLTLLSLTCAATGAEAPVLDVKGNELQVGVRYLIRGAAIGAGPVSVAEGTSGNRCPQNVVQKILGVPPFPNPTPVTFRPANTSETVVRVATDLNIVFNLLTSCPSNVWKVHPIDQTPEQLFITTGGQLGNPGCATINNWFQIVAVEGTSNYKIITNPQVCDIHSIPSDVTVVEQGEQYRLYLNLDNSDPTKEPLVVRFVEDPRKDQALYDH